MQAICDSLGPTHIDALLRKWLAILPHPFTPQDEAADYRYELSVLQAEFSLTQMLDRPVSGRIFFEQVLHDNLDIGRPDQVSLVFDRITAAELVQLVTAAVTATRFLTPGYADTGHAWPIEWGPQLDVRPVTLTAHDATPDVSTDAVAAYLAKYATKATEPTGLPLTGRMNAETAEHYADPGTHLGRLIAYAWQLGGLPSDWTTDDQRERWHDTYGRLRRWTHMLGFGGHFATKSRRYSTTHKALRAARREWRRTTRNDWWNRHYPTSDHPTDEDPETTLIVADLHLAGIGWNTTADGHLAAAAAARARAYRALAREEHTSA